jgi:outer membrane lipoprotein SlyB
MKRPSLPCLAGLTLPLLLAASAATAQKVGQVTTIQHGVVSAARPVDLKNPSAVPVGALIGGGLGLASGSGKSSGTKARNSIIGAVAGGAIAGVAQGKQNTNGMAYTINTSTGGSVQIVTDQREIRVGDCVAVEQVGETANIRRVSSEYCDPKAAPAVKAVASESRKDADECAQAKQQLVNATTTQAAELAGTKVKLLCND